MPASQMIIEEGLLAAMRAENEGFHFYTMAANATLDEKGKEIFLKLADDEKQHAEFLRAQYESIRKTGKPNLLVVLGPKSEYKGASPIFSENIKARIQNAHYEMTALSIGIQLELDAVKHYNKLAEAAGDETIYKFFKDLAEWESGHYRALLDQQDALKEDYWSAGGFSPL